MTSRYLLIMNNNLHQVTEVKTTINIDRKIAKLKLSIIPIMMKILPPILLLRHKILIKEAIIIIPNLKAEINN